MEKTKVLLVKPITDYNYQLTPPLGLGFIAKQLLKEGISVKILVCPKENMTFKDFEDFVKRNRPDYIGFQIFSCDLMNVKKQLSIVKNIDPKIVTFVGGVHPSSVPLETMELLENADYGFVGEADFAFPKMITVLERSRKENTPLNNEIKKSIPGLIWRNGAEINVNSQEFPTDLDAIGPPAWDLLGPHEYPEAVHGFFYKNFPLAPIIVTRGCPFHCTFCGGRRITGRHVRSRSPENVIEELKYLKEKFGIKEFQIIDDNFTANRKNAKDFCEKLIESKLGLTWTCPNGVRLDTLDEELLELMKKAGCYEVAVGIESGSQKILDDMKKGLKKEIIKEKIKLINECGITVVGFIILGYPTDTVETMNETIDFMLELDIVRVSLTKFIPLPGTEITDTLVKEGLLGDIDPSNLLYTKVQYVPKNMTEKQFLYLCRKAFLRFYLRPRVILHHLTAIRSLTHFSSVIKRASAFIKS